VGVLLLLAIDCLGFQQMMTSAVWRTMWWNKIYLTPVIQMTSQRLCYLSNTLLIEIQGLLNFTLT
jgi:hypothetical protein